MEAALRSFSREFPRPQPFACVAQITLQQFAFTDITG
jgi:hypothetical protein